MKPVSIVPTFGLIVALSGLDAGSTFAEPPKPPEPQEAQKAPEAAPSVERPGRGPAGQLPPRERATAASHWWNDPKLVEELTLSDAQRKKMDGYIDAHRKQTREASRTTFAALNAALGEGDWDTAREVVKQLSEQAATPIRSLGELKISLISTLSDEQRKTLVEKHPRLINQLGLRRGRRQQPGPRGGPRGGPRTGMRGGGG